MCGVFAFQECAELRAAKRMNAKTCEQSEPGPLGMPGMQLIE
jgi:hypothetical protein